MNTERQENESFISYIKRITNMCADKRIDYSEWGDLILGEYNCYGSEVLRKGFYVVSKLLNKLDDNIDISSDEVIKQLQQLKDEVYKEKCKLSDQRREYNKLLREEARFENLRDYMIEYMEDLPEIKLNVNEIKNNSNVQAHLILSDFHYGLMVDNVVNYYDKQIAKERLETLINKTIKYCKLHNVKLLHITLAGDLINGNINISNRIEQEEDCITQILEVSELLSNAFNELKKYLNIKVYGVIGNHSRITTDKKQGIAKENFERLIFKYIEQRIGQKVIQNGYEDFINFRIKDKDIVVSHGDKDYIHNAKKHYCDVLDKVVDEIWLGHIHHFEVKDDNGTEIIVNGSLISTDNYALSIRCNTPPYQILRIYDTDTITYKIELN